MEHDAKTFTTTARPFDATRDALNAAKNAVKHLSPPPATPAQSRGTTTPAEQARKHRDLHQACSDVRTAEAEIELNRAKAWLTFGNAVKGLEKQGCLKNLAITITDTEQGSTTEGPAPAATNTNTGSEPATATPAAKVGDVLQEVIAANLPIGTQVADRDGGISVVMSDGIAISYRYRDQEIQECAPYTITYVPPTVPEPATLDALSDMAEGSVVRSSTVGVLVMGNSEGQWWSTSRGKWLSNLPRNELGTLTLLHDAGAKK